MNLIQKIAAGVSTGAVAVLAYVSPALAYGYYDDYSYYATGDAAAATGIATVSLLVYCCFLVVWLGVVVGLTYYVYKDTKKYNVENGILWVLLTFFFNIVGFLIYFLAIRPDAMRKSQESKGGKVEDMK